MKWKEVKLHHRSMNRILGLKPKKVVLVIKGRTTCVGYYKDWSDGPMWVTPGVGLGDPTHFCDCLPEDFFKQTLDLRRLP